MRGFNASGDHLSTDGLSPSGQVVTVPQYKHNVSLDFTRFEAVTEYGLADNWDVKLRVPYDIKQRKASIGLIAAATPGEIDAMQRNLELHHGSDETLKGFSDFHLLLTKYFPDSFAIGDAASISFGSSLPIGKTEANPYPLGKAGLPHEHFQFGNGTFDPLIELSYSVPLTEKLRAGVFLSGRFPLYENSKDYQGPAEANGSLNLSYMLDSVWSAHGSFLYGHQSFAHWDGSRDINTGANRSNGLVGFGRMLGSGVYLSLDYLFPISQHNLAPGGDSFEQGQVFLITTSFSF